MIMIRHAIASARGTGMPYRPLGGAGLSVSALGLGGSTFGGGLYFNDRKAMRRIVEAACEAGVTFFDTSPSYGHGASETLLGEALACRRPEVVIATKGGVSFSRFASLSLKLRPFLKPIRGALRNARRRLNVLRAHETRYSYNPGEMRAQLEASLRRLRTDYVDVYQFYNVTASSLRRDDLFDVMERFKEEGKVRAAGVTVVFPEPVLDALELDAVDTVQLPVSLLDRVGTAAILARARERGTGIIARSPLAQGFLTANDGHAMGYETAHAPLAHLRTRAAFGRKLRALVREGRTMAQAALGYVLSLEGVSTVIFAVGSEAQLRENLGALQSPGLTAEELASIETLAPAAACALGAAR